MEKQVLNIYTYVFAHRFKRKKDTGNVERQIIIFRSVEILLSLHLTTTRQNG